MLFTTPFKTMLKPATGDITKGPPLLPFPMSALTLRIKIDDKINHTKPIVDLEIQDLHGN